MKIPPAWVNIFWGLQGNKENICKVKHHYHTNAQFQTESLFEKVMGFIASGQRLG